MVRLLRRPKLGALLVAGLAAALLGGPALAAQISGSSQGPSPAARSRRAGHRAAVPGTIRLTSAVTPATPATRRPAAQGSICSVPGIGDIGGLLGFCNEGSSGVPGALNNICTPSLPDPEPASAGINSMIRPPAGTGPPAKTLYNNYGVAGQFWPATGLKCSDMTSLIGNNVAGMVFDIAKSIDRVTITVYQSAAGENILGWLRNSVDRLISSLGNAIYFPYLAVVVLIGAIWLAWQGLIRKRGTRTLEGTIWMVLAAAAAIWLIGRPADFTGIGKSVSDGITQTLNVAFSRLPSPGEGSCLPVQKSDPQAEQNFGFSGGNDVVDQNAGELWSVLVCKPWLDGELGTTQFATTAGAKPTIVNKYGRALLWSQAIALNEKPSTELIQAKQAAYQGIAQDIQQQYPGQFPAFQGKEWTTRLEIGFAALFAAVVAGVLVLLIAVTLILLKLGFLLLLVVGPFFLLIGIHPGFGRVVALRWFELLDRRAAQTGGGRAGAEHPAVLLHADHGDQRRGPAVGAEDPDDRAGHDRRVHLPAAVPAPVLRGRLRGHRLPGTGRDRPVPGRGHRPRPDPRRGRGRARLRRLPGGPVGPAQPGGGRGRFRRGGPGGGGARRGRGDGRRRRGRGGHAQGVRRRRFAWRRPAGPQPCRPARGQRPGPGLGRVVRCRARPGRAAAEPAVAGRDRSRGRGRGCSRCRGRCWPRQRPAATVTATATVSGAAGSGHGAGSGTPTGWTRGSGAAAAGGAAAGAAAAGGRVPPGPGSGSGPEPGSAAGQLLARCPGRGRWQPARPADPRQRLRTAVPAPGAAVRRAAAAHRPAPAQPGGQRQPRGRRQPRGHLRPGPRPGPIRPPAAAGDPHQHRAARRPDRRAGRRPVTGAGRTPAGGRDSETGSPPATPFWLRPIRRQK